MAHTKLAVQIRLPTPLDSFVNLLANNELVIDISFDSTGWKTLYALFALVDY